MKAPMRRPPSLSGAAMMTAMLLMIRRSCWSVAVEATASTEIFRLHAATILACCSGEEQDLCLNTKMQSLRVMEVIVHIMVNVESLQDLYFG